MEPKPVSWTNAFKPHAATFAQVLTASCWPMPSTLPQGSSVQKRIFLNAYLAGCWADASCELWEVVCLQQPVQCLTPATLVNQVVELWNLVACRGSRMCCVNTQGTRIYTVESTLSKAQGAAANLMWHPQPTDQWEQVGV